ncbi:MAG: RNA 2',3'-cyclic phosphodiesterase [Planctomycetaceae bacterium]
MAKTSALIRTFIGVAAPASPALSEVLRELKAMGSAIKPADEAKLHVTLKFLGDTPEDQIESIGNAIADVASTFAPHRVDLRGLGVFPHAQRPAVIWIGMQRAETLVAMAAGFELAMCDFGFEPEERTFSPHLTLARVKAKPPRSLLDLLDANRETSFGEFAVDGICLYASELTPHGPEYTVLRSCPLAR